MTAQYTMIVNPVAGSGFALRVEEQLREACAAKGVEADFVRTEKPGHAKFLAWTVAQQGGTAVSVGGDGTGLEVARGVMGSPGEMGIIPAGTGNDLIKTLGIPKDPMEALDWLLTHPARPMDVGTINGQPFLNVCGTGFDVSVLDHAEKHKKHMRGLMPYLLGLLGAIAGNRPIRLKLTADSGAEEEHGVLICSVANGRFIGGGIPICPAADPGDGRFDLVVVKAIPRWKIPFYLPGLMGKKILDFGITEHRLAEKITLRCEGMRVQIDGEIFSMDEAVIEMHAGALRMRY
ncbi:MAG: diacylglycerol kinase family lipid kinase [Clostridia bacterium]|nr:diacylglycerol kinase family lipid kinase [Clostridia bacterium]